MTQVFSQHLLCARTLSIRDAHPGDLAPQGTLGCVCLKIIWVVKIGGGGLLRAPSGHWPGTLLNILQGTGWAPQPRMTACKQNISCSEAEKPWSVLMNETVPLSSCS